LERFDKMMCLSPPQETMRVAMRWWRDRWTRVRSGLFHPQRFSSSSSEVRSARKVAALGMSCDSSTVRGHLMIQRTRLNVLQLSNQTYSCPCSVLFCSG
jgi:hypothetical protein